jgi:hypothetical protein
VGTIPLVVVQSFLKGLLDGLEMPYSQPAAQTYVTPPDPRIQSRIPAIYIWPGEGEENRSQELGGTIPRNSGPNTPSGTKGQLHQMSVYLTWFSANQGTEGDPIFPGMIDAVMSALRYSQPNPAEITDPNTGLTSTVYNVGETMRYHTGLESTEDERWLRYDCLVDVSVWEIVQA